MVEPDMKAALEAHLAELSEQGLRRSLRELASPQGVEIVVDGRPCLNFSSNDYLGLANHPALKAAAQRAVEEFGAGAGASRLVCGTQTPHARLEARLAGFKQREGALTFATGYAAALGTVGALVGRDDVVAIDKLSHACIVDAVRLAGARLRVFAHNDLNKLEAILHWARRPRGEAAPARRVLVITESVFSMDGDVAPLRDLAELTHRHGGWLMVDEAHATGLFGEHRRGLAEAYAMEDQVDVQMGTLGKAVGASGGYVCGNPPLVEYLVNRARSFIFSTAPVPAAAAAAEAGLQVIQSPEGEERRQRVWALVDHLKSGLLAHGLVPPPTHSAIVPVFLGDEARAVQVADRLRERGFFVPAIRYPTVSMGKARLRLTLTASHTVAQIEQLCAALAAVLAEIPEGCSSHDEPCPA